MRSVNETAMLNMAEYSWKDNENQLGANESRFMLFIFTVFFIAVNVTLWKNWKMPFLFKFCSYIKMTEIQFRSYVPLPRELPDVIFAFILILCMQRLVTLPWKFSFLLFIFYYLHKLIKYILINVVGKILVKQLNNHAAEHDVSKSKLLHNFVYSYIHRKNIKITWSI
jgi:hypothetical protein